MKQKVYRLLIDTQEAWPFERTRIPSFKKLSDSERQQIERYYFDMDAKMALASILIKRHLVSTALECSPNEVQISVTKAGRPYCQSAHCPPIIFDFNVSHYGGIVIVVGAWLPSDPSGMRPINIGVDIVECKPLAFEASWMEDFMSVFTPCEWKLIKSSISSIDVFFLLWTCKEAILKALGIGLSGNPLDIVVTFHKLNELLNSEEVSLRRAATAVYSGYSWDLEIHKLILHSSTFYVSVAFPQDCVVMDLNWETLNDL